MTIYGTEPSWELLTGALQHGLPFGASLAALWTIVRLTIRFQQDFAHAYSERVRAQEVTIKELHAEVALLRDELYEAEAKAARFERILIIHGIEH